jgi:hypothetical protein
MSTGGHAGLAAHMRLVEPDAGGAGDALEDQRRFLFMFAGRPSARRTKFFCTSGWSNRAKSATICGSASRGRLRQRVAVPVVIRQAVGDDGLRHRLATGAAHLAPLAADLDRQGQGPPESAGRSGSRARYRP